MTGLRVLAARLRGLLSRRRLEQDLDEEIRSHLEMQIEDNVRAGMEPEDARFAALRSFGGVEQVKEEYRERRGLPFFETTWADVRYGLRGMARSPVLTLVALASLALGIGANTAIFSVVDALVLRALPVHEPHRLVLFGKGSWVGIQDAFPNRPWELFSLPFYRAVRERSGSFSELAGIHSLGSRVHGLVNGSMGASEAEPIEARLVSGTYFSLLGVNAALGRTFSGDDDRVAGGHPIAVASHGWWQRRLGSDPSAVGRTVSIGATTYTIVGVAPRGFTGITVGESPDIWIPLAMMGQVPPAWKGLDENQFQSLYLVGRLAPGVTLQQADADLNVLFKRYLGEWAGPQPGPDMLQKIQSARIVLTRAGRGLSQLRREFATALWILMAVVGLVLLIACANVANLLLARAAARERELAVRMAIGAGRARLLRQLLTESLLFALLGGTAGLVLAWWGGDVLVRMVATGSQTLRLDVTPDGRVLTFTIALSALSAVLFGTMPALRATRLDPHTLQGNRTAGTAPTRRRLGKTLVASQVALSLSLLIGAGLLVRTLVNLQRVDVGFDRERVLLFSPDIASLGVEGAPLARLYEDIEARVKAVTGIEAAAFSMFSFNQGEWSTLVSVQGDAENGRATPRKDVVHNVVGPGFFASLKLPLILGRSFGPQDGAASPRVAVVNETMARMFFPSGSPLGRRFGLGDSSEHGAEIHGADIEVVGVVRDVKFQSLRERPEPMAYYPYSQQSIGLGNLVVRYSGDAARIAKEVRRAIKEVKGELPIWEVTTLSEQVDRSLVRQKLLARLATFFGGVALLLACIGLFGTTTYAVTRRVKEMGIRVALGAGRGDVLWMVLRQTMGVVLVGVVVGLAASLALSQLLAAHLYAIEPTDPSTLVSAVLVLTAVALAASIIPARRASRVDPMIALRND